MRKVAKSFWLCVSMLRLCILVLCATVRPLHGLEPFAILATPVQPVQPLLQRVSPCFLRVRFLLLSQVWQAGVPMEVHINFDVPANSAAKAFATFRSISLWLCVATATDDCAALCEAIGNLQSARGVEQRLAEAAEKAGAVLRGAAKQPMPQ